MQWNFQGLNPMDPMGNQSQAQNQPIENQQNMGMGTTRNMGMNMTMNQGMTGLTDKIVATDLLMAAKAGVKSCATALTESATPEIRSVLKQQLNDAVNFHEQVASYMINKGYYTPYDISNQVEMDIETSRSILNLR